jgi:ubiquinone/menaquinone biosynthesis C-methylase UbiE
MFPSSIENIKSILDVGCGNGDFLYSWKQHYQAQEAMGVEPSSEAVRLLKEKWVGVNGMEFCSAFAHNLPFDTDSFDIVTVWSVLHWVGRNEYLQSLGEIIRVCNRYLIVMDFVAQDDYRVPYSHKDGLFTYKQDFQKVIEGSGIMKSIETIRWWVDPEDNKLHVINEKDLKPFEKNILSYHARKTVIFEKDYDFIQVKDSASFR